MSHQKAFLGLPVKPHQHTYASLGLLVFASLTGSPTPSHHPADPRQTESADLGRATLLHHGGAAGPNRRAILVAQLAVGLVTVESVSGCSGVAT